MFFTEEYLAENAKRFFDLSNQIWEFAETAYQEEQSCGLLCDFLEKEGFRVERGACGIPTAFVAEYGRGKPVLAFLAEYDALPNLSQTVSTRQEPYKANAAGHGCSHNILGVASVAGAVALKEQLKAVPLEGTIRVYGTPAEELLTGKVVMVQRGAFASVDVAIGWHPNETNAVMEFSSSSNRSIKFHYHGKTAHAASDPFNGRSALDAVELLNISANYLREHLPPDVKLHYATIVNQLVPNIVPDAASVWYFVRGNSQESVADADRRLEKCAHAASQMTETACEVEFLGGCSSFRPNRLLSQELWKVMTGVSPISFTQEEECFARALASGLEGNRTASRAAILRDYGVDAGENELCDMLLPLSPVKQNSCIGGSMDIGDVSQLVPTVQFCTACHGRSCPSHSWQETAYAASSIGHKGLLHAAKIMSAFGLHLLKHPQLVENAKDELQAAMAHTPYVSPLPAHWTP